LLAFGGLFAGSDLFLQFLLEDFLEELMSFRGIAKRSLVSLVE
jgi:hypothetical protein